MCSKFFSLCAQYHHDWRVQLGFGNSNCTFCRGMASSLHVEGVPLRLSLGLDRRRRRTALEVDRNLVRNLPPSPHHHRNLRRHPRLNLKFGIRQQLLVQSPSL